MDLLTRSYNKSGDRTARGGSADTTKVKTGLRSRGESADTTKMESGLRGGSADTTKVGEVDLLILKQSGERWIC